MTITVLMRLEAIELQRIMTSHQLSPSLTNKGPNVDGDYSDDIGQSNHSQPSPQSMDRQSLASVHEDNKETQDSVSLLQKFQDREARDKLRKKQWNLKDSALCN